MANKPICKVAIDKDAFLTAIRDHGYSISRLCENEYIDRSTSSMWHYLKTGYMPDKVLYRISKATGITMNQLAGSNSDRIAREILADLAGMTVDDPLDAMVSRLIFGTNAPDKELLEKQTEQLAVWKELCKKTIKAMKRHDVQFDDADEDCEDAKRQAIRLNNFSIEEFASITNLSTRSYHCIIRAGITTVEELTGCTVNDLMKWRHFGRKSYSELVKALESLGLSLREVEPVFQHL